MSFEFAGFVIRLLTKQAQDCLFGLNYESQGLADVKILNNRFLKSFNPANHDSDKKGYAIQEVLQRCCLYAFKPIRLRFLLNGYTAKKRAQPVFVMKQQKNKNPAFKTNRVLYYRYKASLSLKTKTYFRALLPFPTFGVPISNTAQKR